MEKLVLSVSATSCSTRHPITRHDNEDQLTPLLPLHKCLISRIKRDVVSHNSGRSSISRQTSSTSLVSLRNYGSRRPDKGMRDAYELLEMRASIRNTTEEAHGSKGQKHDSEGKENELGK